MKKGRYLITGCAGFIGSHTVDRLVSEQQSQSVQEPDWDQLYENDPLEWMKQKEQFRSNKEKSLELQQEQFRLQQEQHQEQQAQMQQFVTQQHDALLSAIPEWNDPDVMAREKNEIKRYAQSIGYTADEVFIEEVVSTPSAPAS